MIFFLDSDEAAKFCKIRCVAKFPVIKCVADNYRIPSLPQL